MEEKIAQENLKLKEGEITSAEYVQNIFAISEEYGSLGM